MPDDIRQLMLDRRYNDAVEAIDALIVKKPKGEAEKFDRDYLAYRPRQMVHVRGVICQVDGDAYTVAKNKLYKLSVLDNRGKGAAKDELLEQLRIDNGEIQRERQQNLNDFYRNDIKGGAPAEAVLQ